MCNHFIEYESSLAYELLKNSIEEFTWGIEQTDVATGFEQFTTTLEMLLLERKQSSKTKTLAKRVAMLLEDEEANIKLIYNKMKLFYGYRSDSLHEGDGQNITNSELTEQEEIVRRVLKKYLKFCWIEISSNPSITWAEIKAKKIGELEKSILELNANIFVG